MELRRCFIPSDLPTGTHNSNFTQWGVVGKFPWIFGIFHVYESESELRGNYDNIRERMPLAAADPMCKGFVYWPENSHSDSLILEFLIVIRYRRRYRRPMPLYERYMPLYGPTDNFLERTINCSF